MGAKMKMSLQKVMIRSLRRLLKALSEAFMFLNIESRLEFRLTGGKKREEIRYVEDEDHRDVRHRVPHPLRIDDVVGET